MKNKQIVFPITAENFHDAWEWVDENRRKSIVRKYVRKISCAVGNPVFFLLMCILVFGYYRRVEGVHFQAYLRTIPVLPQMWDWLIIHVFKPELGMWGQLGLWAVILYGIPFTLEALCSGIVRLCCKPKANPMP